jgi:hypothetical protein
LTKQGGDSMVGQQAGVTPEVQELADKFARYLWAWTDETELGEPDFDGIANATDLAAFLARLAFDFRVSR